MSNNQHIKIFATSVFPDIAYELLNKEKFSITTWEEENPITESQLIEILQDYHVLYCTSKIKISKEFINQCSHLELISQYAAGYDNIDVDAVSQLGIPLGYTPSAMSDATADIAFGLMLATARKMFYMHKTILKGDDGHFIPKANLGFELKNKTLGVFGLGNIGIELAKRCKGAYNMNILYYNRTPNSVAEQELGAKYVDFSTLLKQSDIISVHCSLNETTKGIFNKEVFQQMKPSSLFINTSRGQVHNEIDLIDAVKSGEIWGAGLDVTNPEPMAKDNPLLTMENVCVLPHIGSATIEARNKMATLSAQNIIEFYKSNSIPNCINPKIITNGNN